jgi:hypothetical protein
MTLEMIVHELYDSSEARCVMLVDYDGQSVADAGEVHQLAPLLTHGLSGRSLEQAGSLMKLLASAKGATEREGVHHNISVVGHVHLLLVAYGDDANPSLPTLTRQARVKLQEVLEGSCH